MDEPWFQILRVVTYFTAAMVGGFMAGLFPAAVALKRNNTKYAKISLSVCTPVGFFGGFSAAFLVALVLIVIVLKRVPAPAQSEVEEDLRVRMKNQ